MTYLTYINYVTYITYATYMICISCVGYKKTHFIIFHTFKVYKKPTKHFS